MANEFKTKDEVEEKVDVKKTTNSKQNLFLQVLNGEFLVKDFVVNNLFYVFFFIFLLILSVTKGYYSKQLVKDTDKSQKNLDATIAEYVEIKAKLEEETRRIELVNQLGPKGLKETTNPAKVIRIKKEE